MTPPKIAGWNLALRFCLEMGALVGLGVAAWKSTPGFFRWVLVVLVPLAAAVIWGVLNVPDDPSRSGRAPVKVRGWIRLTLELTVLLAGVAAVWTTSQRVIAIGFAALIVLHYATSWPRVRWLSEQ